MYDLQDQPFKVLIERDILVDKERSNRQVPIKVYYPVLDSPKRLPLILWSHGFGGGRDGASFLARYVAGHGYIVIHTQHIGTDTSLWEGKPGHPWDILRDIVVTKEVTFDRFNDIPFVLDSLPKWFEQHADIEKLVDYSCVGMSGHSFGALSTQVAVGAKLGSSPDFLTMDDQRISAAISYSPTPAKNHDFESHETLYGDIDLPILYMTGTDDVSPLSDKDYTHRIPIFEHTGSTQKHLYVLDDADHMVFAGSRGKLGFNQHRAEHEMYIRVMSVGFWDHYLKNGSGFWDTDEFQEFVRQAGQLL
jgi:dienelactone hydrolase